MYVLSQKSALYIQIGLLYTVSGFAVAHFEQTACSCALMITIEDSIEVQAAPEKVYEWLVRRFESNENYRAWHPDHISICWIKGTALEEGSVVYAEEYLHGELHKLKFRITEVVPNRRIAYRALFPASLFAPGNAFVIEPKGEDTSVFTATGLLRAGPLFQKLGKKQIEATKLHMKEEGENLKAALEAGK